MKDGILKEEEERYMHQLHKSYLENEGNARIFESSISRLKWNLKFTPKVNLIIWSGIIFRSWNVLSYNRLIHDHWRLVILTFFEKRYTEIYVWL